MPSRTAWLRFQHVHTSYDAPSDPLAKGESSIPLLNLLPRMHVLPTHPPALVPRPLSHQLRPPQVRGPRRLTRHKVVVRIVLCPQLHNPFLLIMFPLPLSPLPPPPPTGVLGPTYQQLQKMKLDKSPFVVVSVIGQELLTAGHHTASAVVLEAALKIGTCSLKLRGSVCSALSSAHWSLGNTEKSTGFMTQDLEVAKTLGEEPGVEGKLGGGPRRLVEGGAKGLKGGGIAAHNKELKVERVTIGDLIAFA